MANGDGPRNADFVGRVVTDPNDPPQTRILSGWFGDAAEEGYRRLYTDPELSNYVDIPHDAILYSEEIRDAQPAGGVIVWVKADGELKPGGTVASRAAKFLQGQVQQDFANGEIPSLEKAGIRCATQAPQCAEVTGFTGQCTEQPQVGGAWPCITTAPHCAEITGFTGQCTHQPWPNPTKYVGCTYYHCPTQDLTCIPYICNIVATALPGCGVKPRAESEEPRAEGEEQAERPAPPETTLPGCGYTQTWGLCPTQLLGCHGVQGGQDFAAEAVGRDPDDRITRFGPACTTRLRPACPPTPDGMCTVAGPQCPTKNGPPCPTQAGPRCPTPMGPPCPPRPTNRPRCTEVICPTENQPRCQTAFGPRCPSVAGCTNVLDCPTQIAIECTQAEICGGEAVGFGAEAVWPDDRVTRFGPVCTTRLRPHCPPTNAPQCPRTIAGPPCPTPNDLGGCPPTQPVGYCPTQIGPPCPTPVCPTQTGPGCPTSNPRCTINICITKIPNCPTAFGPRCPSNVGCTPVGCPTVPPNNCTVVEQCASAVDACPTRLCGGQEFAAAPEAVPTAFQGCTQYGPQCQPQTSTPEQCPTVGIACTQFPPQCPPRTTIPNQCPSLGKACTQLPGQCPTVGIACTQFGPQCPPRTSTPEECPTVGFTCTQFEPQCPPRTSTPEECPTVGIACTQFGPQCPPRTSTPEECPTLGIACTQFGPQCPPPTSSPEQCPSLGIACTQVAQCPSLVDACPSRLCGGGAARGGGIDPNGIAGFVPRPWPTPATHCFVCDPWQR